MPPEERTGVAGVPDAVICARGTGGLDGGGQNRGSDEHAEYRH